MNIYGWDGGNLLFFFERDFLVDLEDWKEGMMLMDGNGKFIIYVFE